MKTMFLAVVSMTALLVISGCRSTHVAGVSRSQEELEWEKIIRANYPGYRPAPTKAPAVYDNTEDRISQPRPKVKLQQDPVSPDVKSDAEVTALEPIAEKPVADAEKPVAGAEKPVADAAKPVADAEKSVADAEKVAVGNMPPDPTASTVYVVKSGDTLGKIAQQHYGSARHSGVIFKANADILKNPNQLRPGMKLIVPKL